MAAMNMTGARIAVIFVFCLMFYSKTGASFQWKDADLIDKASEWSKRINYQMQILTEALVNNMKAEYNKDLLSYIRIDDNNGKTLVNNMAKQLHNMLGSKMKALEDLVAAAEDAVKDHRWINDLKIGDVHYWDAKNESQLNGILEYNERFLQPINSTVSTVHIPVEIYNGNIDILNGLKWSNALDVAFKKNYEKDPDILWQYFGSQTGFMRTFPGSKWGTKENEVDLFDVRRRPWYTQGSSSPKDMLILIDTSGSVHGQALSLIKVAVKSILDTLGENDFVNIANFSKNASYVSCFNTFVQANYRNKKILRERVDKIEAEGMADFQRALTFAFDEFDKNSSESGAKCNRMIMLLTDGGTEDAENVFNERNFKRPKQDQIRVFTYAVGQTANPNRGIKWMACANRGKFSEIPAMGAIRARVQGLGMMTTVTLPVYNKTDLNDREANQTILGVMGTDVTTAQMEKFSPIWKLGPNGYSFAINANGYVMFHPRLKVHDDFKDPPNMDFLDIEVENEDKVQLRMDMTKGLAGSITMETYVISADNNHTDLETRHYYYTGIQGTSFSLGVSIPSYQSKILSFTDIPGNILKNGSKFIEDGKTGVHVAPWKYAKNGSPANNLSDIYTAYKEWESKGKPAAYWDNDRILHLHWDLTKTGHLNEVYRLYLTNSTEAIFIGTYGGLTRVFPPDSKHKKTLENYRDTWDAAYFKRAIDFTGYIYNAPYTLNERHENDSIPEIMITHSIKMSGSNIQPAVVGGFVRHDKLVEIMGIHSGGSCKEDDVNRCYLLDDGGFMVATNQRDEMLQIGRFFGRVDPVLMHELYNNTEAYGRLEHFDYQATCTKSDNFTSSAIRLRVPSIHLLFELLSVNWWSSILTWWVTNLSFSSWMNAPVVEPATAPEFSKNCIKKQAQYYFKPNFKDGRGEIDCKINCTRNYVAVRMNETNLLFLITNAKCGCEEVFRGELDLLQEPEEFPDETTHFCNMKPRYRRVTEPCYDYHEKEKDDCGGPLSTPVSVAVIVIATIVTIMFTWVR